MSSVPAAVSSTLLADTDQGKGSPIGLFVVLVLVIAVYFLYRSMAKHIRRVPQSFDPPPTPDAPAPSSSELAVPPEPAPTADEPNTDAPS
jgi:hypothetical protein